MSQYTYDFDYNNMWMEVTIFYTYEPPKRGVYSRYPDGYCDAWRDPGQIIVERVVVRRVEGYGRDLGDIVYVWERTHQPTDWEKCLDQWAYNYIVQEVECGDDLSNALCDELVENA